MSLEKNMNRQIRSAFINWISHDFKRYILFLKSSKIICSIFKLQNLDCEKFPKVMDTLVNFPN